MILRIKIRARRFFVFAKEEVNPFGIEVVIVRPGAIRSGWRDIAGVSLMRNSGEGPYKAAVLAMYEKYMGAAFDGLVADPSVIADVVERELRSTKPKAVYIAPLLARKIVRLRAMMLTEKLRDTFGRKFMGLPKSM